MRRIAIIPARSGSKGLKDKNIAELCGRPLLAWAIRAASESGCFDDILVSSDSPRYLRVAEEWGARPVLRDPKLARDDTATYPVIADLLDKLGMPEDFTLLQPTSPLRRTGHIREAMALFETRGEAFDYVVSVSPSPIPSVLIHPIDEDRSMKHFAGDYSRHRRQDYPEYCPNGAIYIADTKAYLAQRHFYGPRALAYVMSREDSVDIDNELDLELARLILTRRKGGDRP